MKWFISLSRIGLRFTLSSLFLSNTAKCGLTLLGCLSEREILANGSVTHDRHVRGGEVKGKRSTGPPGSVFNTELTTLSRKK